MRAPGPRSVAAFLRRLRAACREDRVTLTEKAGREATEDLGWDAKDVVDALPGLKAADFLRVERSPVQPGGILWVFTPEAEIDSASGEPECMRLWIRLLERDGIRVISFHEG